MVRLQTLTRLSQLEEEMRQAGRTAEQRALHVARLRLARLASGLVSTGVAARRLDVSIPTVKRWVRHGTLAGQRISGRWLVTEESVDRVLAARQALDALAGEEYPTPEDMHAAPSSRQ
ncbi:MAG TPA: helix-turn-helix domain-containing protein [Thermomicrobiales bacterium]|nr:helix-turn-helix domain-containing protein [Thermomicrobiales bacterium]